MTRVNVGIDPSELCDQHLLAELRELPRCYSHRTDGGPEQFTLGTGHVLWCARHQLSLRVRHRYLRGECVLRELCVAPPCADAVTVGMRRWPAADEAHARPLLINRINERLAQMVREPCWTNRTPPDWALYALEARHAHA